MKKAVFIDKDGTLIKDVPYNVLPAKIELDAHAAAGLSLLQEQDYLLIVVTNQPGVALGYFSEAAVQNTFLVINELLRKQGVRLDGFYYCPHHVDGIVWPYAMACNCRKPAPGMLFKAATEMNIDLRRSWMIGDILHDVEAGNRAGCRTILIDNGNETEWKLQENNVPAHIANNLVEAATFICSATNYTPYYGNVGQL